MCIRDRGRGHGPLPRNFFLILDLKMAICGAFLVQFFCSSAKTLRRRKDTLAQVYFYWGAIAPSPPRDRRHCHFAITNFHFSIFRGHLIAPLSVAIYINGNEFNCSFHVRLYKLLYRRNYTAHFVKICTVCVK